MDNFGTAHVVMLATCVVTLPFVVLAGRWERRTGLRRVSRGAAIAIPVVHVPTQIYDIAANFELGVSLPFHLSDLAWVAATIALWNQQRYAVALTYFWGLVLTSQAVITPSLGEDFPEVRFFAYWFIHLLVVWAAVFLVWGRRCTPTWHDYRVSLGVTLAWAVAAYSFNAVAGTNYGYLQRKPSNGSILDVLGPWPVYVLAEIVIVALLWAAMTAPWTARRPSSTSTRRAPG